MRVALRGNQQHHDRRSAEQVAVPDDNAEADSRAEGGEQETRPRRRPALAVAAALSTVLALFLGIVAYGAHQEISRNESHVDGRATDQVVRQVSDTVTKAFSLDYAKVGETDKLANERLQDQALGEYQRLFAPVKQQAGAQKLVVTTTVRSAAVMSLHDDQARVLVFADQFTTRAGTDQYSAGPAQLEATAHRTGDTWKVTEIRLL